MNESIQFLTQWAIDIFWLPFLVWAIISSIVLYFKKYISSIQLRFTLLFVLFYSLPIGLIITPVVELPDFAFYSLPSSEFSPESPTAELISSDAVTSIHNVDTIFQYVKISLGYLFIVIIIFSVFSVFSHMIRFHSFRNIISLLPYNSNPMIGEIILAESKKLDIKTYIYYCISETWQIPFTYGWRTPTIVIPHRMIHQPEQLKLAITHELFHIKQKDYLFQYIEQLITAAFFWFPIVKRVSESIQELREYMCDDTVIRLHQQSKKIYAGLLIDSLEFQMLHTGLISSLAHKTSQVKERILFISQHNEETIKMKSFIGYGIISFIGIVLIMACAGESIIRSKQSEEKPLPAYQSKEDVKVGHIESSGKDIKIDEPSLGTVYAIALNPPEVIGGLASIQKEVIYPESAKELGIEGLEIVRVVVDEHGKAIHFSSAKTIGIEFFESAANAIKKVTWIPGKNEEGQPVKVYISVPIKFRLSK